MVPRLAVPSLIFLLATGVRAAEPAGSSEFFEKKIRPLLTEHCLKCHGDLKGKEPKGGLRLDSRAAMLKGGDNGPALVPGDAAKSKIVEAVRYTNADMQMPPKGKLPDAAIADLTAWVTAGAVWPGGVTVATTSVSAFDLAKRKREHWAWQSIHSTPPPEVKDTHWQSDPLDRFILSKLEEKGLKPAAPADPRAWIRRVSYDLTGLPPTPEDVARFARDPSATAKRKLVEKLLDSPQFGERWGRHWLDLVRYAETRGHEFDPIIPNAYQYRDYVIRALNVDVPYDQFVREHLAGDLLPSPRKNPKEGFNESILGTGFWFLGEEVHSPVDIRQDQADRFNNRIDVLTKTFMALTVACARCHDHKFDAIATKDYYSLFGLLESTSYRLARFDSIDQNRAVAKALAEIDRSAGANLAAKLAKSVASERIADYLLAAREAIRSGPEFTGGASVVFEDFEDGTYNRWVVTGTAFGDKPQTLETIAPYQGKINAQGKYFVNSHNIRGGGHTAKGDSLTGTMTSREFTIAQRYITMLVGGGAIDGKTCVNLLIDGKVVRTATGRNSNQMFPARWDVRDLKGKVACIQIVDNATGGWGNIGVDDIRFTNSAASGDVPATFQASNFSELFRVRIAEIAKARDLSATQLGRWVEITLNAGNDPTHPLNPWAKLALDDAKKFESAVASSQVPLPTGAEVVVDYAHSLPYDFLPDGGSFGTAPLRPGDLRLDADGKARFADYAAAQYDRIWDVLEQAPGAEVDHGALGHRPRAGRTIRTPGFRVTSGKVHYLVSGGAMVYAAVDAHTLIAGPLHGQLIMDIPNAAGFRWVTHDLSAYKGQQADIEFTAVKGSPFALSMVVQSERTPALPKMPPFVPPGKFANAKELALAYERAFKESVERLKGSQSTAVQARLANLLLDLANADDVNAAIADYKKDRAAAASHIRATSRLALAIYEGTGVDEHVFIRGSPKGLGERVPHHLLEALTGTQPVCDGKGSGRLELANQMTDPKVNPFISRVIVNRVWHHLFGRGIVASVDNFGKLGELPTHPELLDYLADRFVREGWSLKRLIREIVLSNSYGMSGHGNAEADATDPQNLLFHKARLRRLDGEAIRDTMLAISGRLDLTSFGPSVPIHLTPFLDGRGRPSVSGPLDGAGRRSIYQSVRRNFLNPMLQAFDTPTPFSTVGRRQVSNVPAQALILLNDPFVQQQAELWAKKVCASGPNTKNRVRSMYQSAFGRDPTGDELNACTDFLTEQGSRYKSSVADPKVWKDLAHTLFNTKEFIYLD